MIISKGESSVKLRYVVDHQREWAEKYLNNMGNYPNEDEGQGG